jgi:hypothetical protein
MSKLWIFCKSRQQAKVSMNAKSAYRKQVTDLLRSTFTYFNSLSLLLSFSLSMFLSFSLSLFLSFSLSLFLSFSLSLFLSFSLSLLLSFSPSLLLSFSLSLFLSFSLFLFLSFSLLQDVQQSRVCPDLNWRCGPTYVSADFLLKILSLPCSLPQSFFRWKADEIVFISFSS